MKRRERDKVKWNRKCIHSTKHSRRWRKWSLWMNEKSSEIVSHYLVLYKLYELVSLFMNNKNKSKSQSYLNMFITVSDNSRDEMKQGRLSKSKTSCIQHLFYLPFPLVNSVRLCNSKWHVKASCHCHCHF